MWPPVHNNSPFSGNCPQNTGVVAHKQLVKQYIQPLWPRMIHKWRPDPTGPPVKNHLGRPFNYFTLARHTGASEVRSPLIPALPESWIRWDTQIFFQYANTTYFFPLSEPEPVSIPCDQKNIHQGIAAQSPVHNPWTLGTCKFFISSTILIHIQNGNTLWFILRNVKNITEPKPLLSNKAKEITDT